MKAILRRTNKAVPAEPVTTSQQELTEDETEKLKWAKSLFSRNCMRSMLKEN